MWISVGDVFSIEVIDSRVESGVSVVHTVRITCLADGESIDVALPALACEKSPDCFQLDLSETSLGICGPIGILGIGNSEECQSDWPLSCVVEITGCSGGDVIAPECIEIEAHGHWDFPHVKLRLVGGLSYSSYNGAGPYLQWIGSILTMKVGDAAVTEAVTSPKTLEKRTIDDLYNGCPHSLYFNLYYFPDDQTSVMFVDVSRGQAPIGQGMPIQGTRYGSQPYLPIRDEYLLTAPTSCGDVFCIGGTFSPAIISQYPISPIGPVQFTSPAFENQSVIVDAPIDRGNGGNANASEACPTKKFLCAPTSSGMDSHLENLSDSMDTPTDKGWYARLNTSPSRPLIFAASTLNDIGYVTKNGFYQLSQGFGQNGGLLYRDVRWSSLTGATIVIEATFDFSLPVYWDNGSKITITNKSIMGLGPQGLMVVDVELFNRITEGATTRAREPWDFLNTIPHPDGVSADIMPSGVYSMTFTFTSLSDGNGAWLLHSTDGVGESEVILNSPGPGNGTCGISRIFLNPYLSSCEGISDFTFSSDSFVTPETLDCDPLGDVYPNDDPIYPFPNPPFDCEPPEECIYPEIFFCPKAGFTFSVVSSETIGTDRVHQCEVVCTGDISAEPFEVTLPCNTMTCQTEDLSALVLVPCGSPGNVTVGNNNGCC